MKKIVTPLFLSTITFIAMRFQGRSLNNEVSNRGVVDLEFATSSERLNEILSNWDNAVIKNNIVIDYFFIIFYSWLFYALTDLTIKYAQKKWVINIGKLSKKMVIGVAIFDLLENALMLFTIKGIYTSFTLYATATFAAIKFSLLLFVIIYLVIAYFIRLTTKKST